MAKKLNELPIEVVPLRSDEWLIPEEDMTDSGQALMFARYNMQRARYCKEKGWLVYNGKQWEANDEKAMQLSRELTDLQLAELEALKKNIFQRELNAAAKGDKEDMKNQQATEKHIDSLIKYVKNRRQYSKLVSTLKVSETYLPIGLDMLDADPKLLNTPAGIVDLSTGEMRPHDSTAFLTQMTTVSPSQEGEDVFKRFLGDITCDNNDLANCMQEVVGMALVGGVYQEKVIFAFGTGGNGKTTLVRLLGRVMGDYACTMESSILLNRNFENRFALANIQGKRVVTMGELKPGEQLDRSLVIRLSSSAPIGAEIKYGCRFEFTPSHTTIIETNHLPDLDVGDTAIWDRVMVIPFQARLRNTEDTKYDMADQLYKRAGGAFLAWAIEGAKRYIQSGYRIFVPDSVKKVTESYRQNCNPIVRFIAECCAPEEDARISCSAFYQAFKAYQGLSNSSCPDSEIRKQVLALGYKCKRDSKGRYFVGLKLLGK